MSFDHENTLKKRDLDKLINESNTWGIILLTIFFQQEFKISHEWIPKFPQLDITLSKAQWRPTSMDQNADHLMGWLVPPLSSGKCWFSLGFIPPPSMQQWHRRIYLRVGLGVGASGGTPRCLGYGWAKWWCLIVLCPLKVLATQNDPVMQIIPCLLCSIAVSYPWWIFRFLENWVI